jgi:hypothetical protein
MGYKQGVSRLRNGFIRCLTRHELNRGYVFISNDKRLDEVLDTKDFEVEIGGQTFPKRRLDVSGRFHVPRKVLENIGTAQKLRFHLASRQMLKIQQAGSDA